MKFGSAVIAAVAAVTVSERDTCGGVCDRGGGVNAC